MTKTKKTSTADALQVRLNELEERAAKREIHIHYDMLEAEGLKLKDGVCKVNGEYHIFIDKRKPTNEKIEILEDCLNHLLPKISPDR
jgi:hypothetical protein